MALSTILKYGFRIRTRSGLVVNNLLIHARNEAEAERKLRQMYQHCMVLQCTVHNADKNNEFASAR